MPVFDSTTNYMSKLVDLCFLLGQFCCPGQFLFWHPTNFKTESSVAEDHLSLSVRGASLPKKVQLRKAACDDRSNFLLYKQTWKVEDDFM